MQIKKKNGINIFQQIAYMFSSLIILRRKIKDYTQMNIFSLTPIHTCTGPCTTIFKYIS